METYPDYFNKELNFDLLPKMQSNHYSYANYVIALGKLWCKENGILYSALIASLISSVLQGNIIVEKKDKEPIIAIQQGQNIIDRAISTYAPSDLLYNIYTKYQVPLSDYSEMEFILGHKAYILDKFGNVD